MTDLPVLTPEAAEALRQRGHERIAARRARAGQYANAHPCPLCRDLRRWAALARNAWLCRSMGGFGGSGGRGRAGSVPGLQLLEGGSRASAGKDEWMNHSS